MNIKYGFIAFLFFIVIRGSAQSIPKVGKEGQIKGLVLDSATHLPIEYATVTLFLEGSKKGINGAVTSAGGEFSCQVKVNGYFNILFESIGYQPFSIKHILLDRKASLKELPKIYLSKKTTSLESVTVTAPANLVENKIDKMVFNAEKDLTSQGGVATDILKKIPMVSVDVDGNVELAGSSSIKFLINGKPSTAFGSNIADVLQSIPASQIKSIEVVTNPGAKYDAEGLGGIINIILKHNSVRGVNGNISLSAGSRVENGSVNLNARRGNFGINAFVSGNSRLKASTSSSSERISTDTSAKTLVQLNQDGSSSFRRHGVETGIGFDWTYRKQNNFSGSLNYNQFGNSGRGSINQSQSVSDMAGAGMLSQMITLNKTHNDFRFHNTDASLNYKKTFDKEGQELEIGLRTSLGNNIVLSDNSQYRMPQDSLYFGTTSDNNGNERETEIQLDYSQSITEKIKLDMGGKANFRRISSQSDVLGLQPESGKYVFDPNLSNRLTYHQKVFALYSEISLPVAGLFDLKIGGRYERTELSTYFSNVTAQATEPGYNTWVPSVFLMKKLSDQHTIKLSYSKRIERPDYLDLNPFVNTTDPKNISTGNPYLKPEIGNRIEFSYSYDMNSNGFIMLSAFYRTSKDDIQPYIVYYPALVVGDTTYTNVAVSTRQNVGIEKDAGLSIFGNLHISEKLDIRSNLFFFERRTINTVSPGQNARSFNYRLNLNISYQFAKSLAGEFFGNFRSPRNELQGRYPSFTTYNFALRKQFWNKKGSIALTATNPFNKYVDEKTALFGPEFTINSERKIPFRSFGINFTWKFGRLNFKKQEKENQDISVPGNDG